MVRRTITLPEDIDARVRKDLDDGESFSAGVARLIRAGFDDHLTGLSWIGSADSGDPDLAFRVEEILAELAADADVND